MARMQRERFFQAVRRESSDYVPFYFILSAPQVDAFEARYGHRDYAREFGFPIAFIPMPAVDRSEWFRPYHVGRSDALQVDIWGIGRRKGSLAHLSEFVAPMDLFTEQAEFASYPYPDGESEYLWDEISDRVAQAKAEDRITYNAPLTLGPTIFEIAWMMRGMEQFLVDLMTEPELADYHLGRITEARVRSVRRAVRCGFDVIRLGDDFATQQSMMIDPGLWREHLKPLLKQVIDAAREVNPEVLIDFHSDGNMAEIIPDLIELGIDILNPVQPECMDPAEIKRRFGDRLSFNGTIGTQTTLPFGTPDEVAAVCGHRIATVGAGGGLILAPTHFVEPEVPWENLEAFLAVVREYNRSGA